MSFDLQGPSYTRPNGGVLVVHSGAVKVMVTRDLEQGKYQETLGHRADPGAIYISVIPNHNLHRCTYFS